MRLVLYNGSPRGRISNTAILLDHFIRGFKASEENSFELMYLNQVKSHQDFAEKFRNAQAAIIAFPLYGDSMPTIVKDFIETLGTKIDSGKTPMLPALGFIIQSGFPEAIHSRYIEKYCEKLALRLGTRYIGTVIRGGVEGIQIKPLFLNRRLFIAFSSLGRHFGVTKEFHPIITRKLAGRDKMSALGRFMFHILKMTGLADMYWKMNLKKHGAYNRRFDQPYKPAL